MKLSLNGTVKSWPEPRRVAHLLDNLFCDFLYPSLSINFHHVAVPQIVHDGRNSLFVNSQALQDRTFSVVFPGDKRTTVEVANTPYPGRPGMNALNLSTSWAYPPAGQPSH